MRFKIQWRRFLIALASLLVFVGSARTETRLFVDSRPTNLDPNDTICRLIFREMPRQAFIVSATEDFGATCIDPTVEPDAKPRAGDKQIGLDRKIFADRMAMSVTLFDAANQPIDTVEIVHSANANRLVYLDEFAAKCDAQLVARWQKVLGTQLGAEPKTPKLDRSLPAPREVDRLLGSIDITHAFLAARLVHQSIHETGESPARLGALIRAYAHLGDATRHLIAGQSIGFFARSMMYAQRLSRLAPKDPETYWHRAYAEALFGIPIAAKADLKRAEELGGNAPPAWIERTRDLVNFRTMELRDKARGEDGALASYFAWLTVEHSLLHSLTINFARAAMEQNPGAVRVFDSIGANAGVGLNHEITQEAPIVLNRIVAKLATDAAAPDPIRQATQAAVDSQFDVSAILKLLDTMDTQSDDPGQPLQWSTFASIVRECQFVNAVRRLNFVTFAWAIDPRDERDGWIPLLKKHRYEPFIESYRRATLQPNPQIVAKVKALNFKDDTITAEIFNRNLASIGIDKDPRRGTSWITRQHQQTGNTAYELSELIWLYRWVDLDDRPDVAESLLTYAKSLNMVCPDHPLALNVLLMVDWPEMKDRAPQFEQDAMTNPMLAYGLGTGYAATDQLDAARRLLRLTIEFAPDKDVYEKLANVHLAQNDPRKWLDTWDTYLTTTEDVGLDHAKACEEIAYRLAASGDLTTALTYADRAASSGSAWGMLVEEHVLLRLHQFDKANELAHEDAARYDSPSRYYRFCRMAGQGDLEAARAAYLPRLSKLQTVTVASQARDTGLYYYLEGDLEQARQFWEKTRELEDDPFDALLIALLQLEQNQSPNAIATLQGAAKVPAHTGRERAYAAAILEVLRCAKDPAAIPPRDGEIGGLIKTRGLPAPRGNVCYSLGRICELNHHDEDAKWWYRAAMEAESPDFTCRALTAIALRRLGDDYFK